MTRDFPDQMIADALVIPHDRTPEQWRHACRALDTREGLDLFTRLLSEAGRLTGPAMEAIRNRMDQIERGRG